MVDANRRAFLAGLGAIGAAGVGAFPRRAAAGSDHGDGPFGDPADLEATVDDILNDRVGSETPGATVAIVGGGRTRLTKGYGVANAETGAPVHAAETAFRIGSVAKPVTFTAVMLGVEQGVLDLDTDVNEYLADSAVEVPDAYGAPVTLRHLGAHTAGFAAVPNPGMVERAADVTSVERALVEAQPGRVRPPGEAVAYSNYGAALAGHVVAAAHETEFEEYVQSRIFEPLGMDHSTFSQPRAGVDGDSASPHAPVDDGFAVPEPVYINWRPAGSMTATATDMAAFMTAHLSSGAANGTRIFETATAREIHSTQFERHPAVNNVGYGFWEAGAPGENLLGHGGATQYFLSSLLLAPDDDAGVFVAYNSRGAGTPSDAVRELVEAYDLGFEPASPEPTGGPDARSRAERVAGEYRPTMEYDSGLGELLSRLGQLRVKPTEDGQLAVEMRGSEREFAETDPYVYREVGGTDVLAVDIIDGDVRRAHLSSTQQVSFDPVTAAERQRVVAGTAGVPLAGFALSTLGYAGLGAWRWRQRRRGGPAEPALTSDGKDTSGDAAGGDTPEGAE